MPTFIKNTYVNFSIDFLNTQEVYDFIQEIQFNFFHREVIAELVNDGFATAFWEIDFNAKSETLFWDKNGGIVVVFL